MGYMLSLRVKTYRARNRSGTAPCEVCGAYTRLHRHHINGRGVPMPNGSWNVVDICPTCHARHHDGVIVILGWEATTNGREIKVVDMREERDKLRWARDCCV